MYTSFPFLAVARNHDVPYGEVIRFVQAFTDSPRITLANLRSLLPWQRYAISAFDREMFRRLVDARL